MDERLPLSPLDATRLRMLLEKERDRRGELEQEVARLQVGLARQNERIVQLERENAELRRQNQELREVIAGLTEQNTLLRQQVAVLETENERLSIRHTQARLHREYRLELSRGGISGLVRLTAQQSRQAYEVLKADIRGSPVVHADETGWREDGVPGYIRGPELCSGDPLSMDDQHSHRLPLPPRSPALGQCCGWAAYDHFEGEKQRCWSHLWRDIDALEREFPEDEDLAAWVAGVRAIWEAATAPRPAEEQGHTPEAERARAHRAHRYEQQLLLLCPETLSADLPYVTLAKRCRRSLRERFPFVRDPAVPPTNNQAERVLRPLVIARKVSGGTRSSTDSETRMILHSLAATARLQGTDPANRFF